jgi:DNA-binding HxlR family transcriptional regulator
MINHIRRIKASNSHPPVNLIGTATITENLLKRKWSIIILRHLSTGLTNSADICKYEPELSLVALNERLRTMQRYGLISRHPQRASATIIVYKLTVRGHKILRLLALIEQLDELPNPEAVALVRTPAETAPLVIRRQPSPRPSKKRSPSLAR